MKVTITIDNEKYNLLFGEIDIINGKIYEISEKAMDLIRTCTTEEVQNVIKQIVNSQIS